jgi:hypothetical protein
MVKDAIRLIAPAQRRIEVNADFLDLPAHERRPRETPAEPASGADA